MERTPVDYIGWHATFGFMGYETEESKQNNANYVRHVLPRYLASHEDLQEDILKNLQLRRVIKRMSKEQVRLILGEPEKIERGYEGREIWWYHTDPGWSCLLQPAFIPFCLVSPALYDVARDEIYWHEAEVQDLQEYHVTGPLMSLP